MGTVLVLQLHSSQPTFHFTTAPLWYLINGQRELVTGAIRLLCRPRWDSQWVSKPSALRAASLNARPAQFECWLKAFFPVCALFFPPHLHSPTRFSAHPPSLPLPPPPPPPQKSACLPLSSPAQTPRHTFSFPKVGPTNYDEMKCDSPDIC